MNVDDKGAAARRGTLFSRLSSYAANALRYWEPRRLVYNAVLALVVIAHFVSAWPVSREKVYVAFCAAYVTAFAATITHFVAQGIF